MVLLTQVKINSIDVTSYLVNYEEELVYGDSIAQCELKFVKEILNAVTLDVGQTVEIWQGFSTPTDLKIFSGFVEKYQPETGQIQISAKDKLWDLVRKEVTHTYDSTIDASAGVLSEIFKDLVTTYGLLTADAISIQDSGTTIILDKFVCNHADVFDRCKALAIALDWQFYYRADTDKVYFEPKGFNLNSTILTVGSNVIGLPKWNYDTTEMVNDLTVVGAFQEIETTEDGQIGVTSGYTTANVLLNFTPISVKVYNDNNNPPTTLKVGGMPDSTGTFDYYVDKNEKKIYPKSGTNFVGNSYFEARYSHAVPIPIHMYNQTSINSYGQFKKTVTFNDLRTVADAEVRGIDYLSRYSTPFIYSTLKVKSSSLISMKVGDLIQVVDNLSPTSVNRTLVINRIRHRYPGDYTEIDVGDKYWRLAEWQGSVEERLKRLAEDQFSNQDIVTELVNVDTMTVSPVQMKPRYLETLTQTADGTTLIWDHPIQGFWSPDFLLYYKLDESSGNPVDSSPYATATTNVSAITFTTGKIDNCSHTTLDAQAFTATATQINIGTADFAISLWVKTNSGGQSFVMFRAGVSLQYALGIGRCAQNGFVLNNFAVWHDGTQHSGTTVVNDGNWHHVVATRVSGTLNLYVDTNLDTSFAESLSMTATPISMCYMDSTAGSGSTDLYVDDIRFYPNSLNLTQVTAIYNAGILGLDGIYVWGGDAFGAETLFSVMQYQNNYLEEFTDTDFIA